MVRLPVSVRLHIAAIVWPRETVAVFSWSFRIIYKVVCLAQGDNTVASCVC